jgi:hypothetical protein
MRPPTRSTRSVRTHPNKATTSVRRSRGASGPTPLASSEPSNNTTTTPPPKPRPQRASSSADAKVDPDTSPGSDPAPAAPAPLAPPPPGPVITCFPVFPPPTVNAATFVLENRHRPSPRPEIPLVVDPHNAGSHPPLPIVSGNLKPPRPRHRMSSSKLETLDAFFRRNTHPSRREKEAICKDLDV